MTKIFSALVLALLTLSVAQAAPTLTFTAQQTSGTSAVVPVLTWSTTPAASMCTASGDPAWTGSKAVAGTVTLSSIVQTKSYTLNCTWAPETFATLDWTVPTLNSDGSSYTDPNGYNIHYGTSSSAMNQSLRIPSPSTTTTTINSLPSSQWFFCIGTVNLSNVEGLCSNVVSKDLISVDQGKTVTITVTPAPQPGVLTVH